MSIYDFNFTDSRGNPVEMASYRGKVLLIVNTATKCGLSNQLSALEELYQKHRQRGLEIIGFPCNQFAGQEPLENQEMAEVCRLNYGVSFLLSEKILVNGPAAHPIFTYLKNHTPGGVFGSAIKWNFTKFLISADGEPLKRYAPTTSPEKIEADLPNLLNPMTDTPKK